MSDKPLQLRDEIFTEILYGKENLEIQESDPNVLQPKDDGRPKSEILSPEIKKRLQAAGEVALSTKEGRRWVEGTFGEVIKAQNATSLEESEFIRKAKEKAAKIKEDHERFKDNSLGGILSMLLKIRSVVKVFKDIVKIINVIKSYVDDYKKAAGAENIPTLKFVANVLQNEKERQKFLNGLFDKLKEPVRQLVIDAMKPLLSDAVIMVIDITKEILFQATILALAYLTQVLFKIPAASATSAMRAKAVASISNILKTFAKGATKAATAVTTKATTAVGKAAAKTGVKTLIVGGGKVITKIGQNVVVRTTGTALKYTGKGAMWVSKKAWNAATWGARKTTKVIINKTSDALNDLTVKIRQNPGEILAMKHLIDDTINDISEMAMSFFGTFARRTKEQDNQLTYMDNILNEVSSATLESTLGYIDSADLYSVDDFDNATFSIGGTEQESVLYEISGQENVSWKAERKIQDTILDENDRDYVDFINGKTRWDEREENYGFSKYFYKTKTVKKLASVSISVNETSTLILWTRFLVESFAKMSATFVDFFNSIINEHKLFNVTATQAEEENTQEKEIVYIEEFKKRYVELTTDIRGKYVKKQGFNYDFNEITGFNITIVNGDDTVSISEKSVNGLELVNLTEEQEASLSRLDSFSKTITDTEEHLRNLCNALNDLMASVTLSIENPEGSKT